jgi:zeta-carotene desaturase
LACLWRTRADADPPFQEWLLAHRQTPRTVQRFWGTVLTSALNEIPERVGLRYARKVFVEGFLRHRHGLDIELPRVPLGRLYGEELQRWFEQHQVQIHLNGAAKSLNIHEQRVQALELRNGERLLADWYLAAAPLGRLLDLLANEVVETDPYFQGLNRLETSPITSAHLWYSRPVVDLPHVVLVDCVGQWVFTRGEVRGEVRPGEHYLQVVVSAARQFRGLGHEEVQRRIVAELAELFPAAMPTALRRARVVTEHEATFSAVPGVDRWRPVQMSPLANLFLAGDWTATDWPATMEGAVRSGYLAAEAILTATLGHEKLVPPDL